MKNTVLTFTFLTAAAVLAQPAGEASRGLESYGVIAQRNIFNPERRPYVPEEKTTNRPAPPRKERMKLTGTLVSEGGSLAFVEGNDDSVKRNGERIQGWRIARIQSDGIVLTRDEETIRWPVGGELEREGDGPWKLVSYGRGSSNFAGAPAGGAATSAEEILKRLRERRSQEVGDE